MKKGEEKRQAILLVAEKLFYAKGYDETSVQDILDVLKASKGSFYHHFESKDAVLETLCTQRAEKACEAVEAGLAGVTDAMERLNAVLHGALLTRREEVGFLAMILPLLSRPEGRMVRLCCQEALADAFAPLMTRELSAAADAEAICPPVQGGMAGMVLMLINQCWLELALRITGLVQSGGMPEPALFLEELELYRSALTRLLDAPYGSIELISLPECCDVAEQVARRLAMG